MVGELNWSEFMRRMRHEFEELVESKPADVQDVAQALRKHDESITFLDALRDGVAEVNDTDVHALPRQMQRHGYYASIQGPWLVCSKSKKQHDTMLFAAQAAQLLAEANMMVVARTADQYAESSIAA
jgi:hypothetical protein